MIFAFIAESDANFTRFFSKRKKRKKIPDRFNFSQDEFITQVRTMHVCYGYKRIHMYMFLVI
jgi:hypothetical protein